MMDWYELAWMALLFAAMYYWWCAYGMKELALAATRRYCKQVDVVLLDDSVVLRAFWVKRDASGRLRMWRRFNFEFTSTGEDRYQGRVVLLGERVEVIQLEPHKWV